MMMMMETYVIIFEIFVFDIFPNTSHTYFSQKHSIYLHDVPIF